MALQLVAYVVPLDGGVAYVATDQTLETMRGTGALLTEMAQPVQLVLCVPVGETSAAIDQFAARTLFRRAAVAATAPRGARPDPPSGRRSPGMRRTVAGFGWLLLLTGGTWASGVAGLWVALGGPAVRRRVVERAGRADEAIGLARPIATQPIEVRPHAGLAAIRDALVAGIGEAPERYRSVAGQCAGFGMRALAAFYEALARGDSPDLIWAEAAGAAPVIGRADGTAGTADTAGMADGSVDGTVHEPA